MSTQTYICPNCQGKGCPVCQNSGQVALSDQEVQELQKLATKTMPPPTQGGMDYASFNPEAHSDRKIRSQIAGVFTLIILALVSGSGFLSWFLTKTFKPFFQFWSVIMALVSLKPILALKFFQEEKVKDFVGEVKEQGVKIKLSPLYPLI